VPEANSAEKHPECELIGVATAGQALEELFE